MWPQANLINSLAMNQVQKDYLQLEELINTYNFKDSVIKIAVIASDGLWDVFTNEEVFEFLIEARKNKLDPRKMLKDLVNLSYDKLSQDNITIVVVEL